MTALQIASAIMIGISSTILIIGAIQYIKNKDKQNL